MRAAERATVEQADGVVCLTSGVRDALAELFSLTAPTLILPSGTALPPPTLPDDAERDLDIFYAGKLERRKGVYDLIESMRFLPQAHCWIAGGSEEDVRELQETVEVEDVADRVTLLGFVPPAEVEALYKRARVGVCSLPEGVSIISERYTSPMKILNMMACRTPVVATNLPSIREVLEDGTTALLAPPNDPPSLAAAVGRLLDDRGLALRLATAASDEVKRYTWTERALRLREFLRSLP
jgi:glycosyltransferase involved in cell wall biosynthesis